MKKIIYCFFVCLIFSCQSKSSEETKELNFFGCACSETLDVMVGSEGAILTSFLASLTWEKANVKEKDSLLDVFYSRASISAENTIHEAKFYAVGHNGTVLISDNGINWITKDAPNDVHFFAVAAHKKKIVAVGHRKVIYVSEDTGQTWQKKNLVANKKTSLYDVSFGNGMWISVGDYGAVLKVEDANNKVSETVVKLGINKTLKGIAFSEELKRWVAVGHEGIIFISDDAGSTWQEVVSETKEDLLNVAFNGKRFVAVGTHGMILTSKDGSYWKKVQVNNNGTFRAVSCSEKRWLLITIEGKKEVFEDAKLE